jgi:hypothetical protein
MTTTEGTMKRLRVVMVATMIAIPSPTVLAQTRDASIHDLRRAGERPRIDPSDEKPNAVVDPDDVVRQQRSRLADKRSLGNRIDSASQLFGIDHRSTPNGRLNTRVLGRIETRLSSRLEGSAAGSSAEDRIYGRAQEATAGTAPR